MQPAILRNLADVSILVKNLSKTIDRGVVLSTVREAANKDYRITVLSSKGFKRQSYHSHRGRMDYRFLKNE